MYESDTLNPKLREWMTEHHVDFWETHPTGTLEIGIRLASCPRIDRIAYHRNPSYAVKQKIQEGLKSLQTLIEQSLRELESL